MSTYGRVPHIIILISLARIVKTQIQIDQTHICMLARRHTKSKTETESEKVKYFLIDCNNKMHIFIKQK